MSNDLINNTNKKTINVHLDIDYNIYKNKIKKYIFVHISLIYNMFDEEFIDNFVKLYILYKKDLLESNNKKYAKLLIDFYSYLKSVEHIDQKEYFLITIKLLNIFILIQVKLNIDLQADSDDKTIDLNVHMEDIFVIGFMTNHSYGSTNVSMRQDFYNFENIEKDGMMDQVEIMKQLKKKYTQYQIESNGLTIQMDPASGNNLALERINKKMPIGPFESTNN